MITKGFPIECGPPRKIIYNMEEYLTYVNLYNGKKKAIYSSIYKFNEIVVDPYTKPNYDSAVVDKLYYDFDDKSCNAWEECFKLHFECRRQNLKHMIVMSGRGYHLYIFTTDYVPTHKKEAIRGGQEYFIKLLELIVDAQVIGNVAQMARIPNTYHPIAKRFCIPLMKEQFLQGDEFCKSLAEEQNFVNDVIIGDELFDINKFDEKKKGDYFIGVDYAHSISNTEVAIIKDESPFIARLMAQEHVGWSDRYLIILYFKEKGYSRDDVLEILKQCLSERTLHHCIKEERQLQYLFSRDDLTFPSFEKLKEEGRCTREEEYGPSIYK